MACILNIDTALETASVCIAKDGRLINFAVNEKQREHAAWLQPGIQQLLSEAGLQLKDLDAVAISNGPGSYTGLRIGLSSAKGLCYALNIPLIAINTLDMMAQAAINAESDFFCPMIDARRMEVFTAVYDKYFQRVIEPTAIILEEQSFEEILRRNTILFFGNGSVKYKPYVSNKNAIFESIQTDARCLIKISDKRFNIKDFDSVAYTQPNYIKEFHHTTTQDKNQKNK